MSALVQIDPGDLRARQRAIDEWSLAEARAGLAESEAKRLPMSIEMYRRSIERLERKLG